MSTYMPKAGQVDRKWYVLDAAGKPLGRVAVQAANLLRGKHKVTFAPHVDCGDHVIIINAEKAVLTGNKLTQKYYYRHTGYIGHLRAVRYDTLMAEKPGKGNGARRKENGSRYHHRPRRHDQTAHLCWRRAQPRRTEARSLGTIRIGGTQDVR